MSSAYDNHRYIFFLTELHLLLLSLKIVSRNSFLKTFFSKMGWKLVECWIFSKEKLKGFESIDIFNEKLKLSECSRGLQGSLSLSLSPDSRRKFTFCKNKKCKIFWSWKCWSNYCRMRNVESRVEGEVEVGKIYDLLFVRVVKMCSVSSFHTKDIKLDSINNRAL